MKGRGRDEGHTEDSNRCSYGWCSCSGWVSVAGLYCTPHYLGIVAMKDNPYNTRQWQRMRKRQLEKEPLCRMCKDMGRTTVATVADHKIQWKTGKSEAEKMELFWDENQLTSLCAHCHSAVKQSEEGGGRAYDTACGVDGLPADSRHPWASKK